jgi:hypothetical protein
MRIVDEIWEPAAHTAADRGDTMTAIAIRAFVRYTRMYGSAALGQLPKPPKGEEPGSELQQMQWEIYDAVDVLVERIQLDEQRRGVLIDEDPTGGLRIILTSEVPYGEVWDHTQSQEGS